MPDPGNPISALYPGPPNLSQNTGVLGGNPLQAAYMIQNLQSMQGQRAAGSALIAGLNPDGTFNPAAAVSAGQGNPNIGWAGAQFARDVLSNRALNAQAGIAEIARQTAGNQGLASYLAGFNPDNLSSDDVQTIRANAVKFPGTNPAAWGPISTPAQMSQAIKNARVAVNPGSTVTPSPAGFSPEGAAVVGNQGDLSRQPIRPVGMAPEAAADFDEYNKDLSASPKILAGLRPLQNALPLIEKLSASNFGGNSEGLAQLKSILVQAGVMDANDTSLPNREMAKKYLNQAVSALPHATDMGLTQDKLSSPNFDLTQPANMKLIKNVIAMGRMDAAAPLAAGGAPGYRRNFKTPYYSNTDPRAFQFDLMSPEDRANLQTSIGPKTLPDGKPNPAYQKFIQSFKIAKQTGMLEPPQAAGPVAPAGAPAAAPPGQ